MEPLAGMRVLDLSRLLPGPYCAWLLRSWGARVVKIEDLEVGDYLREMQPVWFEHLNAGAESVCIDLKRPGGRDLFLRLVQHADVVIEGFRPGVMDRLGLGFDALQAANPQVVLVSVSGYGSEGELAGRAGHDLNYLARSGLLSLMHEIPPIQLADLTGGLTAAAGALAAVVGARATGRGTHVEASLLDALHGLGGLLGAEALAGHEPRRETMPLAGAWPCYNIYETRDGGRVTLGALEPKFWRSFCEAVGHPDWVERHLDVTLKPDLEALFKTQPSAWWGELAARGDLCLEPVRTVGEAARDRPDGQPVRFDGARPARSGTSAPARGAHTWEFLQEAGLSEQEIRALTAEAVIPFR